MSQANSRFMEALQKVFKFFIWVMIIIAGITLLLFQVEFHVKKYDTIFRYRLVPDTYYGMKIKEEFEIWKVKEQKYSGVTEYRIYPF